MTDPGLSLVAYGLACVHGDGAEAAQTALAQGVKAPFRRLDSFFNAAFEKQIAALPAARKPARMQARLPELLQIALADLRANLPAPVLDLAHGLSCTLLLGEAGFAAGTGPDLHGVLEAMISDWLGSPVQVSIIDKGAAGFGLWAQEARGHRVPHLLIAVDSRCTTEMLFALDSSDMLFSRRNPYGLIPGEAAMASLFVPGPLQGHMTLHKAAVTVEPVLEFEERDTDFAAMSEAAALCLDAPPELWIADVNNSRYRAAQLAHAVLRVGGDATIAELSSFFGDCGADNGCLGLVLAKCLAAPGTRVMLTGSNQGGLCFAVLCLLD